MEWAFRETDSYALFKKGDRVDHADIWLGDAPRVSLVAGRDLIVTLPRRARRDMKVKLVYDNPVPAPVEKGDEVGKVVISVPRRADMEIPVVAGEAVGRLGMFGRLNAALKYLIWGKSET
jgi:D-alanyl-D-alanine carboxypeptidase (penicillin-binding protein 5/6)